MKDTQTVLIPPPGAEKTGKGGAKDHGPKTFNFDRSYWSFSRDDPTYGAWLLQGCGEGGREGKSGPRSRFF